MRLKNIGGSTPAVACELLADVASCHPGGACGFQMKQRPGKSWQPKDTKRGHQVAEESRCDAGRESIPRHCGEWTLAQDGAAAVAASFTEHSIDVVFTCGILCRVVWGNQYWNLLFKPVRNCSNCSWYWRQWQLRHFHQLGGPKQKRLILRVEQQCELVVCVDLLRTIPTWTPCLWAFALLSREHTSAHIYIYIHTYIHTHTDIYIYICATVKSRTIYHNSLILGLLTIPHSFLFLTMALWLCQFSRFLQRLRMQAAMLLSEN